MRGTYAYDGHGLQRCKKMANNAPPSPPHCHILNHGKGFSGDNGGGGNESLFYLPSSSCLPKCLAPGAGGRKDEIAGKKVIEYSRHLPG